MSQHILIIGAGFVGVRVANLLQKTLGGQVKITLIDEKDHFLFTPRLIDLLGGKNPAGLKTDLSSLSSARGFTFIQGSVTNINRQQQTLLLTKNQNTEELHYDVLIYSPGAHTKYYNIPGAEAYSFPLKSIQHVQAIHARVQSLLQAAVATQDPVIRRRNLSFVVAGGGLSGIESIFALKTYVDQELQTSTEYKSLAPFVSYTVVQAAPQILPGFSRAVVTHVLASLKKSNVQLHVGEPITQVEAAQLTTASGRSIPTRLLLWCSGLEPQAIEISPALDHDPAGFITTDAFLRIDNRLFAAGDAIAYRDQNVSIPKNAQTAFLMAGVIADNVARTLHKQPLKHFHYRSKGNLITLGKEGLFDLNTIAIPSRFVGLLRDFLYRRRFRQTVGERARVSDPSTSDSQKSS